MYLWKYTAADSSGAVISWHISQRVAEASARLDLINNPALGAQSVIRVNVPNHTAGMARFLNGITNPTNEGN